MLVQWKEGLVLVFVLCTGLDALSEKAQNQNGWLGYSYEPKLEGWIKLHTEPADWHTARVKCHMEGAFLASPWYEEFAFVLNKLQSGNAQLATLYSGVHKTFEEGALAQLEGKLVMSTHPRDLMKLERCGVFVEGSTGEVRCDELLPFVCYRPEPEPVSEFDFDFSTQSESEYTTVPTYFTESTTTSASTQTSPTCGETPGYVYAVQMGLCYKFHTQAANSRGDAQKACRMEGAFLAIVNSDDQVEGVTDLFEKYSGEKIPDAKYSDFVAIGILKSDNKYSYGEIFEGPNSKYETWGVSYLKEDALSTLFVKGLEEGTAFICEKDFVTESGKQTEGVSEKGTEQEIKLTSEEVTEYAPEQATEQTTGLSALALTKTPDCEGVGYEYSEETGQCYKFHALAVKTWYDAKAACEEEDAYLAIINNDVEAQVLAKIFAKYPGEKLQGCYYIDTAAIGYYKSYETNEWVTIHGETLEQAGYNSWRPGGPHPWAKLGFIYRDGLLAAYVPAIRDVPYICEKKSSEPKPEQESELTTEQESTQTTEQESTQTTETIFWPNFWTTTEPATQPDWATSDSELDSQLTLDLEPNFICGDQSLGYGFSKDTQHCYKFHAQSVHTWYDAKAACEKEGAYLAIVNSDVEALVLKELFAKYPADKIYDAQYTDTAAIGYLKNGGSYDEWQTINGETLQEAGYEAWRPDAPHPWATLGFFYRDGLLYGYVPAIRDVPFICEKEPLNSSNGLVNFYSKPDQATDQEENEIDQTIEDENEKPSEEESDLKPEQNHEQTVENDSEEIIEEIFEETTEQEPEKTTEDELILMFENESGPTTEFDGNQVIEKESDHTTKNAQTTDQGSDEADDQDRKKRIEGEKKLTREQIKMILERDYEEYKDFYYLYDMY